MTNTSRAWVWLIVVAALAWHAIDIGHAWRQASRDQTGRDYASYHYGAKASKMGLNPYTRADLKQALTSDGVRANVHPFFYPPPFIAMTGWVDRYSLVSGYRIWFWLDEMFALLTILVLAFWWAELGSAVPAVLAATLALMTAVPNNHIMGQANFGVLFLVVSALWSSDQKFHRQAGVLMGLACMLKMSPALFVMWWILRGKMRSVFAAVGTAIVASLVSLFWVDTAAQIDFYTRVLPTFGTGGYNGLSVGIDLFGNHSIPNLYNELYPTRGFELSDRARMLSSGTMAGLVVLTGLVLRHAPVDRMATAGQVSAVAVLMLLVPVFTYEHHLVWAIPGVTVTVLAVKQDRLPPIWWIPLGIAIAWLCTDLAVLKRDWQALSGWPTAAWMVREGKFFSLVILYAACLAVGRSKPIERFSR